MQGEQVVCQSFKTWVVQGRWAQSQITAVTAHLRDCSVMGMLSLKNKTSGSI